jgi:hypothetical protein
MTPAIRPREISSVPDYTPTLSIEQAKPVTGGEPQVVARVLADGSERGA